MLVGSSGGGISPLLYDSAEWSSVIVLVCTKPLISPKLLLVVLRRREGRHLNENTAWGRRPGLQQHQWKQGFQVSTKLVCVGDWERFAGVLRSSCIVLESRVLWLFQEVATFGVTQNYTLNALARLRSITAGHLSMKTKRGA